MCGAIPLLPHTSTSTGTLACDSTGQITGDTQTLSHKAPRSVEGLATTVTLLREFGNLVSFQLRLDETRFSFTVTKRRMEFVTALSVTPN
jgi:hypothetical protein